MGETLLTEAEDAKGQLEFNPEPVRAYRLIGYWNRAFPDHELEDEARDAGEIGACHSADRALLGSTWQSTARACAQTWRGVRCGRGAGFWCSAAGWANPTDEQ